MLVPRVAVLEAEEDWQIDVADELDPQVVDGDATGDGPGGIPDGEAATEGAGIAHQVLGAIGFTKEHTLHRFTRRLWAWRDDFGNESAWAVKLGAMVAAKGADELWPMLAER